MIRQITSVVKLTVPTIGNCASAQMVARTKSTHFDWTRLTMKPTMIAEIENSRKKDDPRLPNFSWVSPNSVLIGTPWRPTTILSAKFTTISKNSRKVIVQAPFGVAADVVADVTLDVACA